ncbi:MAG: hypothetical protein A2096_12790 [Spirochaetes bacterium GWF1_41_5]|nr:MAG: hypothetical protein A2096_12790 [Spirochaetes bacterium GWF1_41_5]HBE04061.1 hypothetical protein [Spirochaetia bacterium]
MKKNIILFAVLLLAGALSFYAWKTDKKKKEDAKPKKIFSVDEERVFKWEINYHNERIVCEKISNEWLITFPKKYPAAYNAVFANVKNFNTLQYISAVSDNISDEHKYGFPSKREYTIYETALDGSVSVKKLIAGAKTYTGGWYCKSSETQNRVFDCEFWVVKALEKTLDDLREKDFLKIEPEEIIKVSYGTRVFEKQGMEWTCSFVAREKTDLKKIEQFIQDIGFMVAEKICPDDFTVSRAGLDKPQHTVRIDCVQNKTGKQFTRKLMVNKKDVLYARSDNDPYIYQLFTVFQDTLEIKEQDLIITNTEPETVPESRE